MNDTLILDISDDYKKFKSQMFPLFGELRYRQFCKDTIQSILEYIHSAKDGADLLQEFADVLEEAMTEEGMQEHEIEQIKQATIELGQAMLRYLLEIGAYDIEGHLGFKFKDVIGFDIALQPLTPEDLADDDVDVNDVEDPNAIAEQRSQSDVDNLYATSEEDDPYNHVMDD